MPLAAAARGSVCDICVETRQKLSQDHQAASEWNDRFRGLLRHQSIHGSPQSDSQTRSDSEQTQPVQV